MPDAIRVAAARGRTRIVLDAPHGNAITDAMVAAMRAALGALPPATRLVTLESAGSDFSFGSSLAEHVPARMPDVLPRFHGLIRDLLRTPAVTAAVVGGRCLGGGFELALACDIVFAAESAVFGLPEISVGAFPPAASVLLPCRVGAARAAQAILTGVPQSAGYWHAAGLIAATAPDDRLAATVEAWFDAHLASSSSAALAHAAAASRVVVRDAVDRLLPDVERRYLQELLATADAAEGVAAFLEKRPPRWQDR